MTNQSLDFEKKLAELRELNEKGNNADAKKFGSLADFLLWEFHTYFSLPMEPGQLEFIRILATSEVGGEYWKGVGEALTLFLIPLNRSLGPHYSPTAEEKKDTQKEPEMPKEDSKSKKPASDIFEMD